ncbi:hypothetical protein HPB50_023434 [Hyalomma asiaticum]|uniref:Uncharacterized protein n=1 Tax=Hyalomma asiaticum TaxID=266040 RepID=A0ACB7TMW0_HYAAI|nr:hypothetical protein HPB50_023434 [Hyalomma asiaticum]
MAPPLRLSTAEVKAQKTRATPCRLLIFDSLRHAATLYLSAGHRHVIVLFRVDPRHTQRNLFHLLPRNVAQGIPTETKGSADARTSGFPKHHRSRDSVASREPLGVSHTKTLGAKESPWVRREGSRLDRDIAGSTLTARQTKVERWRQRNRRALRDDTAARNRFTPRIHVTR